MTFHFVVSLYEERQRVGNVLKLVYQPGGGGEDLG
jgi:hypothetical protein